MKRLVTICALFSLSAPAFSETCAQAYKNADKSSSVIESIIAADVCEQENANICKLAQENEMSDGQMTGDARFVGQACLLTSAIGGNRAAVAGFSDGVVGTNGLTKGCFDVSADGDSGVSVTTMNAGNVCEKETEKFCEMIGQEEGEGNDAKFVAARCRLEAARGANIDLELWKP